LCADLIPDNRSIEGDRLISEHPWRPWQKPAGDEHKTASVPPTKIK